MVNLKVTKLGWFSTYKYRLDEDYTIKTNILEYDVNLPYISLDPIGYLTIKKGYCWDGASGPTWDTKSCRRGSMLHDACYQLIRMGFIPYSFKEYADTLLHDICIEDGMWQWRADAWIWAVDVFGRFALKTKPGDFTDDSDYG